MNLLLLLTRCDMNYSELLMALKYFWKTLTRGSDIEATSISAVLHKKCWNKNFFSSSVKIHSS